MPRIPTDQTTVPLRLTRPASPSEAAQPFIRQGRAALALGQSVFNLGQTVSDIGIAKQDAMDRRAILEGRSQLKAALDQLENEKAQDPTFQDAAPYFVEGVERTQAVLDAAPRDFVRNQLEQDLNMALVERAPRIIDLANQKFRSGIEAAETQQLHDLESEYVAAMGDPLIQARKRGAMLGLIDASPLNKNEAIKQARLDAVETGLAAATVNALTDPNSPQFDPEGLQEMIRSGQLKGLSAEALTRADARAGNAIAAEEVKDRTRRESDLSIETVSLIEQGNVQLFETQAKKILTLRDSDLIGDATATSLVNQLTRAAAALQVSYDATNLVMDAMNGVGMPIDPTNKLHRDAANMVWASVEAGMAELEPQDQLRITTDFVRNVGYLPAEVQKRVKRGLNHSDPSVVGQSAVLFRRLADENHFVAELFTPAFKSYAEQVFNLASAGGGLTTEAVQKLKDAKDIPSDLLERRRDIYSREQFKQDNDGNLKGRVNRFFAPDPKIPGAMLANFETLTRTYFELTEDIDMARDLAERDLLSAWSRTDQGWEKWAMEHMVPVPGAPEGWARRQLIEEVQELVPDVEADAIIVAPHTFTPNTVPPSWSILIRNELGQFEPVPTPDGTDNLTFTPRFDTSPDAREMREALEVESKRTGRQSVQLQRLRSRDDYEALAARMVAQYLPEAIGDPQSANVSVLTTLLQEASELAIRAGARPERVFGEFVPETVNLEQAVMNKFRETLERRGGGPEFDFGEGRTQLGVTQAIEEQRRGVAAGRVPFGSRSRGLRGSLPSGEFEP